MQTTQWSRVRRMDPPSTPLVRGVFLCLVLASVAAGLAGEDQSPFRAELEGLLQLVRFWSRRRSLRFSYIVSKQVFICADCESALAIAEGRFGDASPLLARRLYGSILRLRAIFSQVTLFWVPSHNKDKPANVPGTGYPGLECGC